MGKHQSAQNTFVWRQKNDYDHILSHKGECCYTKYHQGFYLSIYLFSLSDAKHCTYGWDSTLWTAEAELIVKLNKYLTKIIIEMSMKLKSHAWLMQTLPTCPADSKLFVVSREWWNSRVIWKKKKIHHLASSCIKMSGGRAAAPLCNNTDRVQRPWVLGWIVWDASEYRRNRLTLTFHFVLPEGIFWSRLPLFYSIHTSPHTAHENISFHPTHAW